MPLFVWNDTFSLGVKSIDDQHKKLMDIINRLHDAMKTGTGGQIAGQILTELVNYTNEHLKYEEKIFKQYNYPDMEAHLKIHTALTTKVADFQQRFQKGNSGVAVEISIFLKDWLLDHILKVDKKYVPFFTQNGIK